MRAMANVLSPRVAVPVLLVIATAFGSNHVAARIAFAHGTSVATAVTVRAAATAVALLALLALLGVSLHLARADLQRLVAIGALVALQSACLYSAVARMPVALALLVFNLFPLLYTVLAWIAGERPPRRAALAAPLAVMGLALALEVGASTARVAARGTAIGEGVLFAFAAAVTFAFVLFANARWAAQVDGRLRTLVAMATKAIVVGAMGALTQAFAPPADATGWIALAALTVLYGSAFVALFAVLPRIGAAVNTVALNFEPVAALAIAWVLLGEALTPLQLAGALLVVAAIVLLGLRRG